MSRELRCEALVVGAGPAGASAAKAMAQAGIDVLVLERRKVIGRPVRCAEYIPAPLARETALGQGVAVQKVEGMQSFLHGKLIQDLKAPGFIVDRERFDQALARQAESAGARLLTCTAVLSRLTTGEVLCQDGQGRFLVKAGIIAGADGPRSLVASWMDLRPGRVIPAVQASVELVQPLSRTHIYFHESLRAGYAWLFPKGRLANAGLGHAAAPGQSCTGQLKRFLAFLREEGLVKEGVVGTTCGWIPVEEHRQICKGSLLLCGDAAGHTHPVTGAGIFQAVMGGAMAGRWAARALQAGRLAILAGYAEEWREFYGEVLEHAAARRREWEAFSGRLEDGIRRFWIGFREYHAS